MILNGKAWRLLSARTRRELQLIRGCTGCALSVDETRLGCIVVPEKGVSWGAQERDGAEWDLDPLLDDWIRLVEGDKVKLGWVGLISPDQDRLINRSYPIYHLDDIANVLDRSIGYVPHPTKGMV
jgi:hypothetical protein